MTTCKVIWTPTTKEPKINNALVLLSISNCVIWQQKRVVIIGRWVSFYKFHKNVSFMIKTDILRSKVLFYRYIFLFAYFSVSWAGVRVTCNTRKQGWSRTTRTRAGDIRQPQKPIHSSFTYQEGIMEIECFYYMQRTIIHL